MWFLLRSLNNFKNVLLPHTLLVLIALLACTRTVDSLTSALDRNAKTLYYTNQPPNAKGDFHFEFQTSNGITTKAAGNAYGVSGVVQFVSKEGIPITMTYVADDLGYHPSGEHIPAQPEFVERALEYIRTHTPVDEYKSRHF